MVHQGRQPAGGAPHRPTGRASGQSPACGPVPGRKAVCGQACRPKKAPISHPSCLWDFCYFTAYIQNLSCPCLSYPTTQQKTGRPGKHSAVVGALADTPRTSGGLCWPGQVRHFPQGLAAALSQSPALTSMCPPQHPAQSPGQAGGDSWRGKTRVLLTLHPWASQLLQVPSIHIHSGPAPRQSQEP